MLYIIYGRKHFIVLRSPNLVLLYCSKLINSVHFSITTLYICICFSVKYNSTSNPTIFPPFFSVWIFPSQEIYFTDVFQLRSFTWVSCMCAACVLTEGRTESALQLCALNWPLFASNLISLCLTAGPTLHTDTPASSVSPLTGHLQLRDTTYIQST